MCRLHLDFIGPVALFVGLFKKKKKIFQGHTHLYTCIFCAGAKVLNGFHKPNHKSQQWLPQEPPATSMERLMSCGKAVAHHTQTPPPIPPSGYCRCGGHKLSILQHSLFFSQISHQPYILLCMTRLFRNLKVFVCAGILLFLRF